MMRLRTTILLGICPVLLMFSLLELSACSSENIENPNADGDQDLLIDGDEEAEPDAESGENEQACPGQSFGADPQIEDSLVFLSVADGYPFFRIPAIVTTPAGTLVAFSEARPSIQDPGSGEIDMVMKRSTDCGHTWSELVVLAENGSGDAHNPAALIAPDSSGKPVIWLFFNKRPASAGGEMDLPPGLGDDSASIWLMTSADEGLTWSAPYNITQQVKNPDWAIASMGPGRGIVTSWETSKAPAGRMIVPGWYTWGDGKEGEGSFVMLSDDQGETWQLGGLPEPLTNEAQIVELSDGRILLDGRQNASGSGSTRLLFFSNDVGETWSTPTEGLPMTPVMSSILRYSATRDEGTKNILLHSGLRPSGRLDLRVWISFDEAQTWEKETIVREGIVQYSVLTLLSDKTIGLLYETVELDQPDFPLSIRLSRFNFAYMGDDRP